MDTNPPSLGTRPQPFTSSVLPGWNLATALILFAGWLLLSNIGPLFELAPSIRAWYPPAALVAAGVTIWGARALVPIMLAASVNVALGPPDTNALWEVLLLSLAIKIVYWAAAQALRRFGFDPAFSRPIDVALFACIFSVAAAVAAPIAMILPTAAPGEVVDFNFLFRSFWIGDTVAVFALTPAMLAAAVWVVRARSDGAGSSPLVHITRRNVIQAVSVPLALFLATILTPSLGFFSYALCFVPLGWIAVVHGPRVAAIANVVSVIGALTSVQSLSYSAPRSLTVQAFTILLVLTGLMIGSLASERERAFALLADSELQYRRLVELLPDPVLVHVDGRIVFANSAAARVHGSATAASLGGLLLSDVVAPRSAALVEERLLAVSQGKNLELARHTVLRRDGGSTVEVEAISIPFNYHGRDAVLSVARDISARARLEDQLRHAQRMEAVGRLAGGVAHDFNNLLTVITSYSEMALAGLDCDEPLALDLREIHQAAARATSLTRQLLSFSRRQVLQPAPMDVTEAVRLTQGLLRRLIGPGIEIVSHLEPAAGVVLADRGQIEQVIVNLAVNARDAMPNGGTLTLETRNVLAADEAATDRCATRADRYAMIVVRDTGVGIDDVTLAQIFDPFFTTKEVGQGTGLGLASVHGIVEQSGGTVFVRSEIGEGTEFRILLPIIAADLPPRPPEGEALHNGARKGKGRVLVVEDEAAVRTIVLRALRGAGYQVSAAVDGVDALALLERDAAVDVILSDVAMPRMDGRVLAQQVRERWPTIPIIMMSGYANPDTLADISPEQPLLMKPFRVAELLASIEGALVG